MSPIPLGAALEYLRKEFGGDFEESEVTGLATQAGVQIVPFDPERVSLTIINLDVVALWIRPNPYPTSNANITLVANGGSFTINAKDDFTLTTRAWFGAGSTASALFYSLAVRRYAVVLPPT